MTIQSGDILNYTYTGAEQTATLPAGTYKLECWGAQGGSYSSTYYGGYGGYSIGTITFTDETTVYLYVGGQGTSISSANIGGSGGFNGGGAGGNGSSSSKGIAGSGGGGASDIRIGSNSLYARVIVAGGGGGAGGAGTYTSNSLDTGSASTGGYGGGVYGTDGNDSGRPRYGGKGGSGGSSTFAGSGGDITSTSSVSLGSTRYAGGGGGAGGGWYGGGGGGGGSLTYSTMQGKAGSSGSFGTGGAGGAAYSSGGRSLYGSGGGSGGGGSGYVYTSTTAGQYPSGGLLDSTYYLTNASTSTGNTYITDYNGNSSMGHSGNGAVRITVVSIKSTPTVYIKTGTRYKLLEYIESGGNSYFDTGILPTNTTEVQMTVKPLVTDAVPFFGARDTASTNGFIIWQGTEKMTVQYGSSKSSVTVSNPLSKLQIIQSGASFTCTDLETNVKSLYTFSSQEFSSSNSICLFAVKTAQTVETGMMVGRLYSAKIGDVTYTPAQSPDGVIGLYVSDGTFLKANNDGFIAGPVTGYMEKSEWIKASRIFVRQSSGWAEMTGIAVKGEAGWIKG